MVTRAKESGRGAPQETVQKWDKKTLNCDSKGWRSKETGRKIWWGERERKLQRSRLRLNCGSFSEISSALERQRELVSTSNVNLTHLPFS